MLLEAATEVFYEFGYNDATVDMITGLLGSTKAVFYYHYSDKQSVLDGIFDNAMTAALSIVRNAVDRGANPEEQIAAIARDYTTWVIENRTMVGVFWREVRSLTEENRERLSERQRDLEGQVKAVVAKGIESGAFTVQDAGSAARMILGMTSFIYTWWREGKQFGPEETAEQMADAALRLVGARPV